MRPLIRRSVGRSRSETQVAHYAAVKPYNRSLGGGGGGGSDNDDSGGDGGGGGSAAPVAPATAATVSTRTGIDKLDGLPIPLINVPGAENAAGQL